MQFAPYGEPYGISGSRDISFAGLDEDLLTGLDDATFREYHSSQGRWISPDPAGMAAVSIDNPQTWNRYAYVANDPLVYIDPMGLERKKKRNTHPPKTPIGLTCAPTPWSTWNCGGWDDPFSFITLDWTGESWSLDLKNFFAFDFGAFGDPFNREAANNTTNCSHGFGIGVQGGGTAAAGLKSGGVVTGQVGGGLFVNSSGQPSVGAYASGALAGRWGSSTGGYPAQSL